MRYSPITAARLAWQDGQPLSLSHDDIYFSRQDGLAETEHVFLQGNDLARRWQSSAMDFTLAETGFGSGLNFLAAVRLWLQTREQGVLHYISCELAPLSAQDLHQALQSWPQLQPYSDELLQHYPPLSFGFHQRTLFQGRVSLTLLFGDANQLLPELHASVNAWFLDGFAPDKNADLWQPDLCRQLARLSAPACTLATFSVAGVVKRALKQAGFILSKRPGFGRKREMLTACLPESVASVSAQPWFDPCRSSPQARRAVVIGGGLAGCFTAAALIKRGWQVTLIEQHSEIASGASGNLAGVVMPRLTADMDVAGQFYLSAFLHSCHWLQQLAGDNWQPSGVLQLLADKARQRLLDLHLPKSLLQGFGVADGPRLAGCELPGDGVYYPSAGWISPPRLCRQLVANSGCELRLGQQVLALQQHAQGWLLQLNNQSTLHAETVIIANGYQAAKLLPQCDWPLRQTRGQLVYLQQQAEHFALMRPVCYEGYCLPAYQGKHVLGASYSVDNLSEEYCAEDEARMREKLRAVLPQAEALATAGGRVAYRSATRDYLPIIGGVPDMDFYRRHYQDLCHGRAAADYPTAHYLPGLYVSIGHGSRGLVSCPMAAELLAAQLNAEPLPLPQPVLRALHPARFLVRSLRYQAK